MIGRIHVMIAASILSTPAGIALGQTTAASLSGVVKDISNAVVPKARVAIHSVATGQTLAVESDDQGRYTFPNLDIGQHEITASAPGFQQVRMIVELSVGQKADVNISLAPSGSTERVEVSGLKENLTVDTASSTYGQLVTRNQIANLPLNGRDFSQLILLQPGTVQARSDQGDILTGKGPKIAVHGARTAQNAYMLDGTDILDALGRTAAGAQGLVSGIESVQEFAVLTNTYSAEYGRAAGGVFNIATRSGTNQFHGSVFEYLRNSKLDARNFFDADKPAFKRNQFGSSAGGPVIKNRIFLFGAYEGFRERLGITDVEPVPSLAARQGRFLPAGRTINPAVLPYLALIPLPTIDSPGPNATFIGQFHQPSNLDTYNVRLDYRLSTRDSFFARYTQNDSEITFLNPETFPGFPNRGQNNQRFGTASETHLFSTSIVNTFRYAFNRTTPAEEPRPVNPFKEIAFIPGQVIGDIFVSGFKRFGSDRNTPRSFDQDTTQFADDIMLVRGGHSIKLGGNFEHFNILGNSASRNRGEFTINTFSEFLQGISRNFVGLAPGKDDTVRHHRQNLLGLYVQDDWKARPNLTLNLGARYEFITVPTEANGKVTNVRSPYDPAATLGDPLFENPSLKNIAPRVGFAWSPSASGGVLGKVFGGPSRTSIRGGFGIYFDQLLYATYGNMTFKHLPFFQQVQIDSAPFPNVFPLLASGAGSIDTFALDFHPSPSYVMQYNLNVQREVVPGLLVTAAYVGSRGVHLWREADFNTAIALNAPVNTQFAPIPISQVKRRNPSFASIRFKVSDVNSFYNAFQLGVHSQIRKGFRAQVSYTFAKSIDDGSSSLGRNEFANGQARTVDPYNKKLNRGLSDFDVRHNAAVNFSYELPFSSKATTANGFVKAIAAGWQLNGILAASTGIPISPIFTFDRDRDGSTDNEQRPDLVPGVKSIPRVSKTQLFDPNLFVLPAVGSRGNAGRNIITGPGLITFDPSLTKSFYFGAGETKLLQFRMEMFNAFNHPNFAIPPVGNLTIFSNDTARVSTAGQITSTSTPGRQIQFALRLAF